jgi:hypothetical protein
VKVVEKLAVRWDSELVALMERKSVAEKVDKKEP